MDIQFAGATYPFRPWRPSDGLIFRRAFAFDCETTLIDDARPGMVPTFVLGAASDGQQGVFVTREHLAAFVAAHEGRGRIYHTAPFDLAVIAQVLRHERSEMDIYEAVDRDLVHDTELMHRLLLLATEGHVGEGKGAATLAHCASLYLGVELPKDVVDSRGNSVRLSYGRWLGRPPGEIEPVYLEYLGKDVVATYLVHQELLRRTREVLTDSGEAWGYVSPEWLTQQGTRHGLLTHHIQLKAAIVLRAVTANGLHLDVARREELSRELSAAADELRLALRDHGYLPGKGSGKALQAILARIERRRPDIHFPRTETGKISTAYDNLAEFAGSEPFLEAYTAHKAVEKLLATFVSKMGRPRIHPSFRPLVRTGRTSSFGDLNAQNLPRDDRIRNCFVPSPGHVFVDADYSTVELATLAQAVISQFRLHSAMADAINRGEDLHKLVAAKVTGKSLADVTREERQQAKAINFGKPGGMGSRALRAYALANYRAEFDDDQIAEFEQAWFDLYPEMLTYLGRDGSDDTGLAVAEWLGLTAASHAAHTGDTRFLRHAENAGREDAPHTILGRMALKAFQSGEPTTRDGRPYPDSDVDCFWSRLRDRIDLLPARRQADVRNRRPSDKLRSAVAGIATARSVFTTTGRLRANASYCARHNTPFQGLAADGAKLALWHLWRAGYRLVNFIHDEVLVEISETADLEAEAERIRDLMVAGMREVVPDVRVGVEYVVTRRWAKAADEVRDADGRLVPWEPAVETLA